MKRLLLFLLLLSSVALAQKPYFPPPGKWDKHTASAAGFDAAKLDTAIRFAITNESRDPRNMETSQRQSFGREPHGEAIGPFVDRGAPTGLIIHKGYIIAEWGTPLQVEMTHSVTKSFLSTVVGLAVDKGLIRNTTDTITQYVLAVKGSDGQMFYPFATPHNRTITWETMLRQTSDWEGTLWGKPDWADRPDRDTSKWLTRPRLQPGAAFEYNDVRVNAMALAATIVWRKPLPEVLKKYIMDPIGASDTWRWHGYRNSSIILDDSTIQSVSGGGHWGGGMFINAYDMGRFGLLTFHKGNWNGKQLVSEKWIRQATTPTTAKPDYGYMNFFLNTDKKFLPSAPATAYVHIGNGTNMIYVDNENHIIIVARWIRNNAMDGLVKRVLEAKR
jgi:CubicO group peptidase (beta-lactamase class C family)